MVEILADSEHWKHFLSWKRGKLNVAGEKMGKKRKGNLDRTSIAVD